MAKPTTPSATSASSPSGHASAPASVLGKSAHVRGRVTGAGDLRVEGLVEGGVAIEGALSVAGGARIAADVEAHEVVVEGAIEGDVRADAIHLRDGAEVRGDLRAARLSIEEGAAFAGRIDADFELPAELGGKGR